MAITINTRPRLQVYLNNGSPPVPIYSYWNAAWNPIVYGFNVQNAADIASTLNILIYEFGSNTLLANLIVRPFAVGIFNVDISTYVRAYLYNQFDPNFTTNINSRDDGSDVRFYIRYQQTLEDGTAQTLFSDQAYIVTAMQSAMQFGDSNGGNMAEYVPFAADLAEDLKAKFLTAFEIPTKFLGYTMSLSFIYDNNVLGYGINRKQTAKNINQGDLSETDTALDTSQIRHVNYLEVEHPSESLAAYVQVALHIGDAENFYYVDPGYVDTGYEEIL